MYIKKIILSLIFIASFGYFLYDVSLKATSFIIEYQNNKNVLELPDTIYLHSENGSRQFQRIKANKYCSNNTCGHIKNLTQNKFDFYWENYQTLKFKKSSEEKNLFVLAHTNSSKNKISPTLKIDFIINENGENKPVTCSADKCLYEDKSIAPFQFVIAGQKISKGEPFEPSININKSTSIILKNKNNELITLQKQGKIFLKTPTITRNNNFLFIISSHQRPVYLSGLIHSLNFQTYPLQNFDISISLKGNHKDIQTYLLEPDFKDLIKNKRLFIRIDEFKDPLANMLDALRDVDLSNYDYICKINDNDWYHKDYLLNLNTLLNTLGKQNFITSGILNTLEKDIHEVYLKTKISNGNNPDMCFSKNFAEELLNLEKKSNEEIKSLLGKDANLPEDINEDVILNTYAQEQDKKFLYYSLFPLFIHNQTAQSVMKPL